MAPTNPKGSDDIMSVLLAHEKRGGAAGNVSVSNSAAIKSVLPDAGSDSSDGEQSKEESNPSPEGNISQLFII